MLTTDPTLEELKGGVDIVEYVGRHVTLKKQGREYVGLCPLHGEKTPSFYINESKQVFHCRGCGAGGSVLDFIMGIYGINEHEAANQLRSELGIDRGAQVLEKRRILTPEQERAEAYLSNCKLSQPCGALFDYGLILPSAYENEAGDLVVPLRSSRAVEDVFISDEWRGKMLNNTIHDGWSIVGHYNEDSQHLYICPDYIDATYLHQSIGRNKLVIFSPWPHLAIERAKREFPNVQIRLALPHITDSLSVLDSWDGLYSMPSEMGYWCEKSRRQQIEGCKKA